MANINELLNGWGLGHDGYAGPVSIVHKSAAVSEVIAQLAIEADDDPE